MERVLLTRTELCTRARQVDAMIRKLDISLSDKKRALRRNRIQRDLALLLEKFMRTKRIKTLEELADDLYIGWDFKSALDMIRTPSQLIFRDEKTDKEYLIALSQEGT